jgi:hypothetical protein
VPDTSIYIHMGDREDINLSQRERKRDLEGGLERHGSKVVAIFPGVTCVRYV